MSLSNPYGVTEKEIKQIIKNINPPKEQFYSSDGSKCFDTKRESVIPYGLDSSYQSAVCGTAFDYLARFCVAQVAHCNRENALKDLVAERFIHSSELYTIKQDAKILARFKKKGIHLFLPDEIICGNIYSYSYLSKICDIPIEKIQQKYSRDLINLHCVLIDKQLQRELEEEYTRLINPVKAFINGVFVGDETLIDISIILAEMEHMKRSGIGAFPLSKLFKYDKSNDIIKEELKKMLCSFRRTFMPMVRATSVVVYNPHFGIGSRIVGGADADIYVDGVLYDFKTSKKNGWKGTDATQILGYYLLDKIAKMCDDDRNCINDNIIKKIALYKVRYEEVAYFDVDNFPIDIIDNAIKDICRTYLMYNLFSLITWDRKDECIKKYGIPLSEKEIRYYCSDSANEELNWYMKNEEHSDFEEERMKVITESQNILRGYLDSIDVTLLFKNLVRDYFNDENKM